MRSAPNYIPRGFIIFAQIFGTSLAVIGLIAYCALLDQGIRIGTGPNGGGINDGAAAAILALIVYFTWKSIWSCVTIVRALSKMDDMTLCANKWMVSALSLTVGGLFTPFIMSSFPNIKIRSTIKPKVWLTRAFGMFMLVGAPLAMITYGAYMGAVGTGNFSQGWNIAVFVISGFLTVLGAFNVGFFYQKDASSKYETSGFMKFLANLTMVLVTLELILILVESFLELLVNIYEMIYNFSQNGFWYGLLSLINVMFSALYVFLVAMITWETLTGIWEDDVEYNVFEPLQKYQSQNRTVN